jgi:hypothetical protein
MSLTPQQRLMATASQLGSQELEVLAVIAERLLMGQRCYGLLRLATDNRDFHKEAMEEAADGLVYSACALVRDRMLQRETGT